MDSREAQPRVGNGYRASSDEIKAAIDRTRHRMDETLDELGEKFHPRHLFWDAMDYIRHSSHDGGTKVKQATSKVGQSVWHQVQEHPMPMMLIGAGLAWMLMEQQARQHPEYTEHLKRKASDAVSSMRDTAREKLHDMKENIKEKGHEAAEHLKHSAGERKERLAQATSGTGTQVREQIRERATRAYHYSGERLSSTAHHYPLALGAGILAFGLLAGLALPATRTEDELMGTSADNVRDRAREAGEKGLHTVKAAASAAKDAAAEEAHAQGITAHEVGQKVKNIAREAKRAAQEESGVGSSHHPAS